MPTPRPERKFAFVSSQRPSGQFKGLVEEAEGREVSFLKIKVKEREFKRKRKVFNSNGILFNLKASSAVGGKHCEPPPKIRCKFLCFPLISCFLIFEDH